MRIYVSFEIRKKITGYFFLSWRKKTFFFACQSERYFCLQWTSANSPINSHGNFSFVYYTRNHSIFISQLSATVQRNALYSVSLSLCFQCCHTVKLIHMQIWRNLPRMENDLFKSQMKLVVGFHKFHIRHFVMAASKQGFIVPVFCWVRFY